MGAKGTEPGKFSKALAQVLDESLASAGISRNKAAERINASQPRVNRILSGARPIYVDELAKLAALLHSSPSALSAEAERRLKLQTTHTEPALEIDPVQYAAETESKLASLDPDAYQPAAYGERKED